jgi:hypothetical protein
MVPGVHHLVGAAEIGRMLGISRQRVQQLINSKGWPAPEVTLDMGKVWQRSAIEQWARDHDRTLADDGEGEP